MSQEEFSTYRAFVESLFNPIWLRSSTPHRLRAIWQRTDNLAKTEVASFGFFIKQLQAEHKKWLADTARDIRNQTQSPHGLIFEIVTLGSLAARGMNVRPMERHHPGYDAEISGQDGYTLRVSIKNHDISEHEKQFRWESARLANVVRRRVLASGRAWQAVIRSRTHLDVSAFEEISAILRRSPIQSGEIAPHLFPKRGASIQMREIKNSKYLPGSYTCNVTCPRLAYEYTRFHKNINIAIKKFDKHSPRAPGRSNVIFMRVHGSADIEELTNYAREALTRPDCSVDAIMLYQAAIGHNPTTQQIMYYARDVVSPRYTGSSLKFPLQFLSGVAVAKPVSKGLFSVSRNEQLPIDDITTEYSFQRGRLFYRVHGADQSFEFPYSIPGIEQTLVYEHSSGKTYVNQPFLEDEDLFLI
ncbi:hypothetical protein BLA14095_03174 [Burkholderia lata]|nr:hypothetical protein BLA14095_03174 [Burkholderia lata]